MVTIKDIAEKASVTTATVSLALNNKGNISTKTRKRVLKIADEMNYYPSNAAKMLKTNRSKTLGIIVGSLANEFFIEMIHGVESYIAKLGYSLLICDADMNKDKILELTHTLIAKGVDGIIFTFGFYIDSYVVEELEKLAEDGIKMLSFTTAIQTPSIPLISYDQDREIEAIMKRLSRLGHRDIGIIAGEKGSWINDFRFKNTGWCLSPGRIFDSIAIANSPISADESKAATLKMLKDNPEITAIFAVTDIHAAGVMQAAGEMGLKIPEEISVVGCDGISFVSFMTPKLTSIGVPRKEMGQLGAEFLINWIENNTTITDELTLPCRIIEGNSVAEARKR